MSAPTYQLGIAIATLQRALAGEPDEDGVLHEPEQVTEDIDALLSGVLRAAVEAADMADAARQRADEIKTRSDRYKARAENLRAAAFAAMDAMDRKRVELPDLTASVKNNPPRVLITDEAAIPSELTRTVITPDKTAIAAALKRGESVPGAELTNSIPTIQIRTA
jgi:hypothetical protein